MILTTLERSRISTPPISQEIHADQVAYFVCAGFGSFISISWQYNDTRISDDSVVVVEDVSGEARQRHISSTLMINATVPHFTAKIQCILHQNLPPEHNLQGGVLVFPATLTITGKV